MKVWQRVTDAGGSPTYRGLKICRELDRVHVVDPFVTEPEPGRPGYRRLHGISGARHSYTGTELQQLDEWPQRADAPSPSYVLFNNLRVGDAKRFLRLLAPNG